MHLIHSDSKSIYRCVIHAHLDSVTCFSGNFCVCVRARVCLPELHSVSHSVVEVTVRREVSCRSNLGVTVC